MQSPFDPSITAVNDLKYNPLVQPDDSKTMEDYVNEFLKMPNDKILEMAKNITQSDFVKAKEEILNNTNVDEKIKSQISQFIYIKRNARCFTK